jgi:hypothetical protein
VHFSGLSLCAYGGAGTTIGIASRFASCLVTCMPHYVLPTYAKLYCIHSYFNLGEKKKNKSKKANKIAPVAQESDFEDEAVAPAAKQTKSKSSAENKRSVPAAPAPKETRLEYLNRLARGEVDISGSDSEDGDSDGRSDSSSGSEESDYDSDSEGGNPLFVGEANVELIEDATRRLAIQNCEWNSVRAQDLM